MKLLVVDDHPMVRKGLVLTLSFEENIEEVKEASCIKEALQSIREDRPDISIVDLRLGDEDGLDVVQKAKEEGLYTKFLILTSSVKKEDFKRAQELDVDGYILKEAFAEDILYAFHVVQRGKKFYDPEIMRYEDNKKENNQLQQLTQREKDVLLELSNGKSNVEIANTLFISEHTVKKHVSNILLKLQLTHRTQAALLAKEAMSV